MADGAGLPILVHRGMETVSGIGDDVRLTALAVTSVNPDASLVAVVGSR
jgi:hypothetical protein